MGRPAPAIGPGAPLTWPGLLCPGAFSQLPLQADAGGETIIRTKAKAAADSKLEVSFIVFLPQWPNVNLSQYSPLNRIAIFKLLNAA
jgi:hypothetical protein